MSFGSGNISNRREPDWYDEPDAYPTDQDDTPFDAAAGLDYLGEGDLVSQADIRSRILAQARLNRDSENAYLNHKPTVTLLSVLKKRYQNKQKEVSLQWLHRKNIIKIDKDYFVPPKDVHCSIHRTMLDFVLVVGNRPGIDAALPGNSALAMSSPFVVNMLRPNKEFRYKRGRLGWDPSGSMYYFGQRSIGEEVYLGFAPNEFFQDPKYAKPTGYGEAKSSCLSKPHTRIVMQLVADVFAIIGIGKDSFGQYTIDPLKDDGQLYTLGDFA